MKNQFEYLYDVHVNWADGITMPYSIPEFHEWYKDDEVQVYDRIPVVLVSEDLFTYIEGKCDTLPAELLSLVSNEAKKHNKSAKRSLSVLFAFIVTDGHRMLAVDTEEECYPTYKSRLTPRTAEYVEALLPKLALLKTEWTKPEEPEYNKADQLSADLLMLDSKYVQGLTRVEKDMKNILMTYLYQLTASDSLEEVRYWYSEVFPGTFNDEKVKRMQKNTMVRKMFDELKEGWTDRHVRLVDDFTRADDFFEEVWSELKKRQKRLQLNK